MKRFQKHYDGNYLQIIISAHFVLCKRHLFYQSAWVRNSVWFWFGLTCFGCLQMHDNEWKTGFCILNAENGNSNALNMHETNKNSVGVWAREYARIYGKHRNSEWIKYCYATNNTAQAHIHTHKPTKHSSLLCCRHWRSQIIHVNWNTVQRRAKRKRKKRRRKTEKITFLWV